MKGQADQGQEAPSQPRTRSLHIATAWLYGIGCHLSFVIGVGTMMAMMIFGMSRSIGCVPAPWGLPADGMLLLQFPLAHSFLLSGRGRSVLRRLAPLGLGERLSSTSYVLIASLQTFVLFALWTPTGTIWWQASGWLFGAICALNASAWLLLLKSILDAGFALQTGWLGWRAVARGRAPRYPPMPVTGLFRLCRQPIYVAFALTLWTVPTWTPDQLIVAIVLSLYCLIGPLFKEARFTRIFGTAFVQYRRVVPYWWPTFRAARFPSEKVPAPVDLARSQDHAREPI